MLFIMLAGIYIVQPTSNSLARSTSQATSQSKTYTYNLESKVKFRDNYAYIPVDQKVILDLWLDVAMKVEMINKQIRKENIIPEMEIRALSHPNQPFHDLPSHLSVAYKVSNLQEAIKNTPKSIKLSFKPTSTKIVPPTMNGILSIVTGIELSDSSKQQVDKLTKAYGEKPRFGWHITIGQSHYKPSYADVIFNLNKRDGINIARVDKKLIKNSSVKSALNVWTQVNDYKKYFFDKILTRAKEVGFEIGNYKGKADHIILSN